MKHLLFHFIDENSEGVGTLDMVVQDEDGKEIDEKNVHEYLNKKKVLVRWPSEGKKGNPSYKIHPAKIIKIGGK
jgi:hypothetical protein